MEKGALKAEASRRRSLLFEASIVAITGGLVAGIGLATALSWQLIVVLAITLGLVTFFGIRALETTWHMFHTIPIERYNVITNPEISISIEAKRATLDKPDITSGNYNTVLFLWVRLRNRGDTSRSLMNWGIELDEGKMAGKAYIRSTPYQFVQPDGVEIKIMPDQFIYNKTIKPISPGQIVRGLLAIIIEGAHPDIIGRRTTKICVRCEDAYGNWIDTRDVIRPSDLRPGFPHFAGINFEVVPSNGNDADSNTKKK